MGMFLCFEAEAAAYSAELSNSMASYLIDAIGAIELYTCYEGSSIPIGLACAPG